MKNKEKIFVFTGPFKDYCTQYVSYKRNLGFGFGESSLYLLRSMDDYFKQYDLTSPELTKIWLKNSCPIGKENPLKHSI